MAPPDLNSLPPSRSPASSPLAGRPVQVSLSTDAERPTSAFPFLSPRRSSTSLAAAAASANAADQSRRSSASNRSRRGSERRRLNPNDAAVPGPGEPSHSQRQRQPSLGDIHNELEQEQESQVNRMLQMIRDTQLQLDALRSSQSQPQSQAGAAAAAAAAADPLTPASSEPGLNFPSPHPAIPAGQAAAPRRSLSRNPSSANPSPALRPVHGGGGDSDVHSSTATADLSPSPLDIARRNSARDEGAFYQAETAALTRENQLLRQRIRELEKQVGELTAAAPPVETDKDGGAAKE